MLVGVMEVAAVAAPKGVVSRFDNDRSGGCAGLSEWKCGVEGKALARIESKLQTSLQLEERDGTVLELGSDDALGF